MGIALSGCSATGSPDRCDPQAFRAVERAHADRSIVTVCGSVVDPGRVRRSRSGPHRVFRIDSGAGDRVEIDANLAIMGDVPIRRGESAIVHGEYYVDPSGRSGVHWTHRTVRGTHPPGFIVLDGRLYE